MALLAAGIDSDLHVRSQLRQARSSLEVTRSRLAITLKHLASVETSLTASTNEGDTLQVELKITGLELSGAEANLTSTQTNLANANTGLTLKATEIATLSTCLGGVGQALNQISVGDQTGAVATMSGVASTCQSAEDQGQGGPAFPFDFPDPDLVRVGSTYYGYATNSATGNIQMIQSTNLAQWKVLGDAVPHLASWARPGGTWAPGVFDLNGTFVLYYATTDGLTGKQCISVAAAPQPQGPFLDSSSSPLVCQLDLGGSIDPSPFVNADGTPFLTWKSEGANGQPPTIWAQQLNATGTALSGQGPTARLQPTQKWEGGGLSRVPTWCCGPAATTSSIRPTTGTPPTTPSAWRCAKVRRARAPSLLTIPSSPLRQPCRAQADLRCSPTTRVGGGLPSTPGCHRLWATPTADSCSSGTSR